MLQNNWVRLFIWVIAVFFFFMISMVLVSELKPGPSEQEVMLYMEGMMRAMEQSLMGMSMSLENDSNLSETVIFATRLLIPAILIGVLGGIIIRVWKWSNGNGKK
jgi:hypothetical protein